MIGASLFILQKASHSSSPLKLINSLEIVRGRERWRWKFLQHNHSVQETTLCDTPEIIKLSVNIYNTLYQNNVFKPSITSNKAKYISDKVSLNIIYVQLRQFKNDNLFQFRNLR